MLFSSRPNEAILRDELRRLSRWLKDKGVIAAITAVRGRESLTRHGLEEYVPGVYLKIGRANRATISPDAQGWSKAGGYAVIEQ
jgi:hypothetical protein